MNPIKDAIARVSRSVRQLESFTNQKSYTVPINEAKTLSKPTVINKKDKNFTARELEQYRPLLDNYQRKIYQDFLRPLNIPNLKVFNNELPQYNSNSARERWERKTSKDSINIFNNFLQDRLIFNRVLEFLVEITPNSLKVGDAYNSKVIYRILLQQEQQENVNKFPESTPKYTFHEIPPIPKPLTQESFQKYIYHLTHSKFYYKNSSSLTSGLITDILLYTHKLSNTEFKPYRSVHTYNYLIKYFGYDKNQSSFARELLLVMNKDGHQPNIDTINNLLRLCQIHSNIRSITNTYQIILKYLKLSKSLNLDINLTTYNRIYDAINNIFLKEIFLNKVNLMNLPISKNLILRIIDDYMKTTKDNNELIEFIENDLHYLNWKKNSKILNKIIYHKGMHLKDNEEINDLWGFLRDKSIDEYSVKYLMETIVNNTNLTNKLYILLSIYSNLTTNVNNLSNVPIVYKYLINEIIRSNNLIRQSAFIIRGLIYDATLKLNLPIEYVNYGQSKQSDLENYKIFKRIVGFRLNKFEAKVKYTNRGQKVNTIRDLSVLLTDEEIQEWKNIKSCLLFPSKDCFPPLPTQEIIKNLGLSEELDYIIPSDYIYKYEQSQLRRSVNATTSNRLHRLKSGNETFIKQQLIERGII